MQYQFKKHKNYIVLMQLHLMLKIFGSDAWPAPWIFFKNFCSELFGTTLQDVYNMPNTFLLSHSTVEKDFFINVVEICCKQGMLIKSCCYWLLS